MDTRHLIRGIVQQTTVLIAQLSTAAGIRAPLARLADQVFLELSRELEAQGVTRKVAADMFGLALRSYQLKINRLTAAAHEGELTLWEAVHEHLRESGGATRRTLADKFTHDDPADVGAVLRDLVDSGIASRTGQGEHAYYQLASTAAMTSMAAQQEQEGLANVVWLAIYDRKECLRDRVLQELPLPPSDTDRAIETLLSDGRVQKEMRDGREVLQCRRLAIPVGSEQGWETAVFDHFRALATAIAAKLQRSGPRSTQEDVVGGTTLTFSLRKGHPFEDEVYGLLVRTRRELNTLWQRVAQHNEVHPIDPAERSEVTFYFGQSVVPPDLERSRG